MEIDVSKFNRQQLGAENWKKAGGIGTLYWVPQFGKTYGAINFIINPHLQKSTDNSVIIITPSEIIAKQWYNNIQAYGSSHSRVVIYTISYIIANDIHANCSLLVVDELHKYTTEQWISAVDGSRFESKFRLGLTGTYPYDNETIKTNFPVVDRITELEAIENNWISNFVEYNLLLQLNERDKLRYIMLSNPIKEAFELFKNQYKNFAIFKDDYALIDGCYRGVKTVNQFGVDVYIKYDYICNALGMNNGWHPNLQLNTEENIQLNEIWNPTKIHQRAKEFNQAILKRNEILIDNATKLYAIGEIIKRSLKTTICFNESIAFADKTADYINATFNNAFPAVCYHSKIESRTLIDPNTGLYYTYSSGSKKGTPKIFGKTLIKQYVIEFMNTGYFRFLSTAKSLDEGVSIPKIEQVICTGGTTNPITYEQRTARGKTINIYNPDKTTTIINLVFDDFIDDSTGDKIFSRDKQKLILRQRSHSDRVIWVNSVDEIFQ